MNAKMNLESLFQKHNDLFECVCVCFSVCERERELFKEFKEF